MLDSWQLDFTKRKVDYFMADNCDYCANFIYDEEDECYICDINLDEDEMYRFLKGDTRSCPYFRDGDEYKVVRKQL